MAKYEMKTCVQCKKLKRIQTKSKCCSRWCASQYYVGPRNGKSKLTENQVKEIKIKLQNFHTTKASIAKEFNVSKNTIDRIDQEICWTHVRI